MKVLENSSKHNTPKKQKTFQVHRDFIPYSFHISSTICRPAIAATAVCTAEPTSLLTLSSSRRASKAVRARPTCSTLCKPPVPRNRLLPISCFSVNVGCGPAEERVLLTGLHAVADIYCEICKTTLGWKYVSGQFIRDGRTFEATIIMKKVHYRNWWKERKGIEKWRRTMVTDNTKKKLNYRKQVLVDRNKASSGTNQWTFSTKLINAIFRYVWM